MPKTQTKQRRQWAIVDRSTVFAHYMSKYFNLYLNRFTWEGDIDHEQVDFVMRQMWGKGTVACFKLAGSEGSEAHPQGLAVFTPYAGIEWNIYNWPVSVSLIALRGVHFIPLTPQRVDEDAVIGYAQRNHEPVVRVVEYFCRRLAAVEMVLQTNLNSQKYPWLVATGPESERKRLELMNLLLDDNPSLFVELDEVDKAKALVSGAPYILDKLHNYKLALENELREYLGLCNLGVGEKKEHLISNEIDANDEITEASGDVFLDCLVEFADRIRDVLGINISVKLNQPERTMPAGQEEEGRSDEEEDQPNV